MIIVYCFIGPLPDYAIDTVHQTRLFYKGEIYFIVNDHTSPYIYTLKNTYNVTIVPYEPLIDEEFNQCIKEYTYKFTILEGVKGRERLFIYAFERFAVLHQWMRQQNATNVFFMELDNLIYDDPLKWEESFCRSEMAYMFDNFDRCASGICFIKNSSILSDFRKCCMDYIMYTDITRHFMTEMQALDVFWKANPEKVQLLPTHWEAHYVPKETFRHYDKYNDTIFDAAGLGIYFGGIDTLHTGGLIMTGKRGPWSALDHSAYTYEWKEDEEGRLIPYLIHPERLIRINNLHIHSKHLRPHLSKDVTHNQS